MTASRAPAHRPGLSLTEVLIAIFVMAIGLISLLVLFPVGMLNTRWALQDARVAVSANNANALGDLPLYDATSGNTFSLRTDPAYRAALKWATDDSGNRAFWNPAFGASAVVDSQGRTTNPYDPTQLNQWAFDAAGPAPAVYVDSIGATQWPVVLVPTPPYVTTLLGFGVGFSATGGGPVNRALNRVAITGLPFTAPFNNRSSHGTPRVRSAALDTPGGARSHCVLPDDIQFEDFGRAVRNAEPNRPAIPGVQREKRYSWAYMCRTPHTDDPSVVEMSVAVYAARPMAAGPSLSPPGEVRYLGVPNVYAGLPRNSRVFLRGSNEAVIRSTAPAGAPIRRGDWVLDNTLIMPTGIANIPAAPAPAPPRLYFGPFADELKVVRLRDLVPPDKWALFGSLQFDLDELVLTGISNGHFYQVTQVSNVTVLTLAGGPVYVQTLLLDRPARADGYELVHMQNVIDVIEKNAGKTPVR